MKRINSLTAIIMGTVLIFGACQQEVEPEAPTLVSPEDGAVSDTVPPTFVWNTHPDTSGLTLYIFTDTSSVFNEHIQDTAYALSQEFYDDLAEGTYRWKVVLFKDHWIVESETRSFTVDRPDEPQGLDLDTTYFPFGLGYEWSYERHNSYRNSEDPSQNWDKYDTIIIEVIDSNQSDDNLTFELVGGGFRDISNPVTITEGKVTISLDACLSDDYEISVSEPDTFTIDEDYLSYQLARFDDTLLFSGFLDDRDFTGYAVWENVRRIKGIGVFSQGYSDTYEGIDNSSSGDRLLYFYNGTDTIYKSN